MNVAGRQGTVKSALRKGIALMALGLLVACTSDNTAEDAGLWDDLIATGQASLGIGVEAPSQAPELTRAMLAGVDQPLVRVTPTDTGSIAILAGVTRRGPVSDRVIVWRGVDPITVTTRSDLVIATRGAGQDLMSSDVRGLAGALRSGGGSYTRSHVILQGNTEAQTLEFACTLRPVGSETLVLVERRHVTTRFTEECTGPAGEFRNAYWRDPADGTLWQSRQWAGPGLGHLLMERVIK
jgi:hypothetical protein